MNGGVNGTMEEAMELSLPASPNSLEDTENNAIQESNEIKFISEVNSPLEEPCKEDPEDDGLLDSPINNEAFCSEQLRHRDVSNIETEESSQDNSDLTSLENCSNSADYSRGSCDSSQTKSVNNAMKKMEIVDQPAIVNALQPEVEESQQPSVGESLQAAVGELSQSPVVESLKCADGETPQPLVGEPAQPQVEKRPSTGEASQTAQAPINSNGKVS